MKRPTVSGFTLIEIIVSLGVFSVVITIAVGALLMLVAANEQLQSEQVVMTNLSFALDSMTREIRTGTNYFCDTAVNFNQNGQRNLFDDDTNLDSTLYDEVNDKERTQDCATGRTSGSARLHGLAFVEGGDSITGASSERILYFHDAETGELYRRVGNGDAVSIVASDIFIHNAQFIVTGSAPQSDGVSEVDQASVTVYIEASRESDSTQKRYYLQTSVTQRTLDI